jgi:hypothetical protein
MTPEQKRIGELEDALKERKRRNDELRAEINEQNATITDLKEQVEENDATLRRWQESFGMVQDAQGYWTWAPWVEKLIKIEEEYWDLNRAYVKLWRYARVSIFPRPMGRPLAASEEQRRTVLKRRKAGESIRSIAENMELSVRTVRTVIDKKNGADRTTLSRWQRIDPDRRAMRDSRRQAKDINALPKRVGALLERNAELIKRATGLK